MGGDSFICGQGQFSKKVTFELRPKKVSEGAMGMSRRAERQMCAKGLRYSVPGVFKRQGEEKIHR